ncbi:dsRNA-specific ribonuclease [endosymbiont of Euscepes postfasciatus]|uniref:ribonuclease III family protein n=1 Tax=endosymbiont of Euscepes postfasciatus TaxID=650377 RepID=UPI000DC6E07B|nr:ribonuclease III domain-containing protein [endosymbiont of Euscepes postfasciatus]BBA84742.1 dsRNA-specific ribonuclease [endosymbiont of Euscepes postfasciatus]
MNFLKIENKLKYIFKNKNLLLQAISHKSYTNLNNERLEFLGDSILNFIFSKYLYDKYINFSEGDMSKIRSFLINSKLILKISKKIKLNNFIRYKNLNNISNSIIENTFESIIAAIYLDSNYNLIKVEEFIINIYIKYLKLISNISLKIVKNFKSNLQEICNKLSSCPVYSVDKILLNKKYNKKIFYVKCDLIINNIKLSKIAFGLNIKDAEKLFAKKMISFMKYKKII